MMIALSEAPVQSRWVEREVNSAREREDRENRTVLFPIRIDDAVMTAIQPWAADNPPHTARLLRDLKAEKAPVLLTIRNIVPPSAQLFQKEIRT
jgi:riboflavin biosynthesis pyrimidine reductase